MKALSHLFRITLLAALLVTTVLSIKPATPALAQGSVITVNTDWNGIEYGEGLCTLREAITNANDDAATFPDCAAGSGNDTVLFANNVYNAVRVFDVPMPDIVDPDGLTIDGGGDIEISGDDFFRVFHVSSAPLTLKSIVIMQGGTPDLGLGLGGGIYNEAGTLTITNSYLSDNQAAAGGSIYNTGTLTITNSTFDENYAEDGGSAIHNSGTMTLTNVAFLRNTVGDKGSVYNSGIGSITNSIFYENSSTGSVGALANELGDLTIINSTFSKNRAAAGGAADIYQPGTGPGSSPMITLYNNILADSAAGGNCVVAGGTVTGSHNLIENASTACGFTNGTNGNIIGSDPALGGLGGSPSQYNKDSQAFVPLNSNSPAIDAGDDTYCPHADQRGVTRPQGDHCDIGAFERGISGGGATLQVTTEVDDSEDNDLCSLREAVFNANTNSSTHTDCAAGSGNDTIIFANEIGTIVLGSTLPAVNDSNGLTIDGGSEVAVNGNNADRILYVDSAPLTLESITIENGHEKNASSGGGVASSGTLTIANSIFLNNKATFGGGISNGGTLTVINSTFESNVSHQGGGGAIYNGGTMTVTSSTFNGNTGDTYGSGIMNLGTGFVTNSTFYGNYGWLPGAAIDNRGNLTVTNSTFSDNGSSGSANSADIFNYYYGARLQLYNNILANNKGGSNCKNQYGTVTGNNNLIENAATACGFTNGVNGNILGVDPALGSLTGSPAYLPLESNSPAINKGSNTQCPATDQTGTARPQGTRCDMGAYEFPQTPMTSQFDSSAAKDGWILESTETSGIGDTKNNVAISLRVGDDAANKQYRSILSFDTSSLPDDAVIASVTLKFKQAGVAGTNPFNTHGKLLADICKGGFNGNPALQLADFKVACSKNKVLLYTNTKVDYWYSQSLNPLDFQFISLDGVTQFRLRFSLDANGDLDADFLKLYSGDAEEANHPQLVIEYYIP